MSLSALERITEEVGTYYADPLGYVMFNYPWSTDPSIQMVKLEEPYRSRFNCEWGPDKWACEFLDDLGEEIKKRKFNGKDAVPPIRFSTASGHGIGKSTLVSWLIMFILDTRPFAKGVVTANTSDQLRTKTWSEVAKWHHIGLTGPLWDYSNSRGSMSLSRAGSKEVKQQWRCDALTARAENAESFQGLHNANSTAFYIFDEASGIEDPIWEARIGGATDGEPMSFDFGNPTRKSGYFYENTVGKFKDRHIVRQIDSRNVSITNKAYFEQLAEDFGEESDIFKVKCRGLFPTVGSVQFIANDWVRESMQRPGNADKNDPLLIGVDVARFGDNSTVIYPRVGMDAQSFGYRTYNRLDTMQVVDKVIETIQEFAALGKRPSGIFVDGGGLGAGPIDRLRQLGYTVVDVNFGGKSPDPQRYRRRGDYMWGKMREAIQNRLALPRDNDLEQQLTQREYDVTEGKIGLERKKDMAQRGLQSPDIADALALTFAQEVAPRFNNGFNEPTKVAQSEYDPYSSRAMEM